MASQQSRQPEKRAVGTGTLEIVSRIDEKLLQADLNQVYSLETQDKFASFLSNLQDR